ncbi:MAG: hypothetical protein CMI02_11365 [Oceanospirillaceae bacterium]|nr:hypothetical protein [Oceanospirillaceae bacterium]MBT12617.1 hypothetical protein [Oceanospirillaceae bacterium]|tara:strand:+ start:72789 stop:73826 length:1038 start_codon:yes stop_codon:yes gene_type:complete
MILLQLLFLIAFLFPFIPGVFSTDIQPFFIIIGGICALISTVRSILIFPSILLVVYSILFSDQLTLKVLASVVGYIVAFEVCRKIPISLVRSVLWVYFLVSLVGAVIHYFNSDAWGTIRELLSLRNANYEYYAQFAPEPSMYYIQMVLIYLVLAWFDLKFTKLLYFVVSVVTVAIGSDISLIILFMPVLLEVFLYFMSKDRLLMWMNNGSILIIMLYGVFFTFFPDYFMLFLEYFHRSEQVRLYDIGQVYHAVKGNPFGLSDYSELILKFSLDHPGRFKDNDYGSTSALSNIIYSIGLFGYLLLLWIIKYYFKYVGIFTLVIISTIGLSWFPLSLMVCKGSDKNA